VHGWLGSREHAILPSSGRSEHGVTSDRWEASVIIPAHNAEAQIADQLSALASQSGNVSFEVLVVLNRCTDGTEEVVDGFRDVLRIRSIEANERASAGYARNVGAANAEAELLLYCDADDKAGDRWVAQMCAALGGVDFVGGRLVVDLVAMPRWLHTEVADFLTDGGLQLWDARVLYPITASFGCRRTAFEAVGGFDVSFAGAASEDIDLAMRLFRGGLRMGFASDATLEYRPRPTLRETLRQHRGYAQGDAVLAAKEGRVLPVGRLRGWKRMAVATAREAIDERTVSPKALTLAAARVHYQTQAWRSLTSKGNQDDQQRNPIVDYVVRLPGEHDVWLAFCDERDRARPRFWRKRDPELLRIVDGTVRTGGGLVDLEPEGGVAAVYAALTVGSSGSVICIEADTDRRDVAQTNVDRHGVGGIVEVGEQLDLARVSSTTDLVRFDRRLDVLPTTAEYVRLLDATPRAAVLIPTDLVRHQGSSNPLRSHFARGEWEFSELHPTCSDYTLASRRQV
jgi:glycosyltransferase involved in cell wall biosynthesis